ncbi:30S ribosomal protein S2 [Candidatus Parcubacteria bacterium]|nr:30S ribosomal protein S2 [Candidatus Parcubacteria bacterium]
MKQVAIPSLTDLLKAGAHFGHTSRRWNPKMAPFIFTKKSGVHIFDLVETRECLSRACQFLYDVAQKGGTIIFLGTKRQAQGIIKTEAQRCGAMYITERWLGGTLTNFEQVQGSSKRLIDLEKRMRDGEFDHYTKKERLGIDRQIGKLERMVGGIRDLEEKPGALFIVDVRREKTAVREAVRVGVPIAAVVDSNSDPESITYPIPGNDDASRSIGILVGTVANAIELGYQAHEKAEEAEKAEKVEKGGASSLADLGISKRAQTSLEKAGVKTVGDLKKLSEEELLKTKGLGEKSVGEILKAVK